MVNDIQMNDKVDGRTPHTKTVALFELFSLAHRLATSFGPAYAASKRIVAPRRFGFFLRVRDKVGGGNNRLLNDDSFESCMTEQRCFKP